METLSPAAVVQHLLSQVLGLGSSAVAMAVVRTGLLTLKLQMWHVVLNSTALKGPTDSLTFLRVSGVIAPQQVSSAVFWELFLKTLPRTHSFKPSNDFAST